MAHLISQKHTKTKTQLNKALIKSMPTCVHMTVDFMPDCFPPKFYKWYC